MGRPSIYGLTDPRDGRVRYVGKANDPTSRLKGHLRDCRRRNTPVYAWIRKLAGLGLSPGLCVLEADCADWKEAERRIIAERRGAGEKLLNVAEGGDEPHCPLEVRRKNAAMLNAKRVNPASDKGGELYGYWDIMRKAGNVARFWRDRPEKAERLAELQQTMCMLRAMTHEQKVSAGERWMDKRRA